MGRFDRQETEARDLPAVLGTAAEEFRTSIEREVRTVIEAAQSRAAEIERQAEFNASQREQLSEHRAKQIVDSVYNRATRVLDSIDLVESALSGMLDALRAELQSLSPHGPADAIEGARRSAEEEPEPSEPAVPALGTEPAAQIEEPPAETESPVEDAPAPAPEAPVSTASAPPSAPAETAPVEEPQPAADTIAVEDQRSEEVPHPPEEAETDWREGEGWPGPMNPSADTGVAEGTGGSEFEQMVKRQLKKMRASGKSREEAERFLERFHFAGDYLGTLEEIYGDNGAVPAPRRKGLFGRLRRRSD